MSAPLDIEPLTTVGPDELLLEAAEKLDLTQHLAELEANGFTVVPPEKVGSPEFLTSLRDAVLRVHRERVADETHATSMARAASVGAGSLMRKVLWEDPIFVRALLNPVAQTLARAMTGHTCRVSLFDAGVKGAGGESLGLHVDSAMTEPYPPAAQFCNVTYALSEYSIDHGSTTFVPGSHRLLRQPVGSEVDGDFATSSVAGQYGARIPEPVPMTCPAGSIIAWYGTTWHGAVPRRVDGERLSILMYFCRWYLKPQEQFLHDMPDGSLESNVPRLAQLLDKESGWGITDPTHDRDRAMTGRAIYPILDVPRP